MGLKCLFLLLFFLKTVFSFAQSRTLDFMQVYHPIINDAELAIVDSSYTEALDFYAAAFQNVDKPFAKDFYNAAICAFYASKKPLMFEYLTKLAEKNLPFESLKKDIFFKFIIDSTAQWRSFETTYRNTKPLIDKELRDSLFHINQQVEINYDNIYRFENIKTHYFDNTVKGKRTFDSTTRFLLEDKKNYWEIAKQSASLNKRLFTGNLFDINTINRALLDSLREIGVTIKSAKLYNEEYQNWRENAKQSNKALFKIIDEYGFPDENLVGLSPPFWENFWALNILEEGDYRFWYKDVSISRNQDISEPRQKQIDDQIQMLYQAVRQGRMLPHTAQIMLRNWTKNVAFHSGKVLISKIKLTDVVCDEMFFEGKKDKWLWKKEDFHDYSVDQINETRQKIGLEKIDDCYKKLFFKQKTPFYEINAGWISQEYIETSSCETIKKFVKNTIIVE